jgi:hypothetical protein
MFHSASLHKGRAVARSSARFPAVRRACVERAGAAMYFRMIDDPVRRYGKDRCRA